MGVGKMNTRVYKLKMYTPVYKLKTYTPNYRFRNNSYRFRENVYKSKMYTEKNGFQKKRCTKSICMTKKIAVYSYRIVELIRNFFSARVYERFKGCVRYVFVVYTASYVPLYIHTVPLEVLN